ncbi:MAG: hypothetical protein HYU27_05055 [Acidobacteria bacterium]|nr:hypothetical protein [Acidobacteriota bacterium]
MPTRYPKEQMHRNAGAHEEIAALFADPSLAPIDRNIRGLTAERSNFS